VGEVVLHICRDNVGEFSEIFSLCGHFFEKNWYWIGIMLSCE